MKLKIALLLLLATSSTNAQSTVSNAITAAPKMGAYPDKDVAIYKNALLLGDLETATYALHGIIAANPNGAQYTDTLAVVYLKRGFYPQAQQLIKPLYNITANNTRAEILAICAGQLGQPTEAINLYKNLYLTTKNNNFGFELLKLEYGIKRLTEAQLTAKTLLEALPDSDKTTLRVPKQDNKTAQEITLKAGVHYLLGSIYFDLNDKAAAQTQFELAVALNKDYELAQNALQFLTKKTTPVTKSNK